MIRGAVHPVDLGDAKRGHEQRGRRLGLVISIEQNAWSTRRPPGGNSTTSAPNPSTRTTSGCTSRLVPASWRKPATPITDATAGIPGLAGIAARTAVETVHRTASAVSAARSFLDDLRGRR